MKIYGLTGGIGAGKSMVSRLFRILGVPIYDADKEAKKLTLTDPLIKGTISKVFGPQAYVHGHFNRDFVSAEAFKDPAKLNQLNSVIHPAVARDYREWCQNQSAVYLIREAALIYETGMQRDLEGVILVSAPEDIRTTRVLKRDRHRDLKQVKNIISRQLPEEEKRKIADHVIENDGSTMLIPQVLALHEKLSNS